MSDLQRRMREAQRVREYRERIRREQPEKHAAAAERSRLRKRQRLAREAP